MDQAEIDIPYVTLDAAACAHARSGVVGCTRCLDLCPESAIAPDGDAVVIDHDACAGCGQCAAACPTDAIRLAHEPVDATLGRARTALRDAREAGIAAPVVLVHDARWGAELVETMAREGRGWPDAMVPLAVNEATQAGPALLLGLVAYGAAAVRVMTAPANRGRTEGLEQSVAQVAAMLEGLGLDGGRVALLDGDDPFAACDAVWAMEPPAPVAPLAALPMGAPRDLLRQALDHLATQAEKPPETIPLPAGAPFGRVLLDDAACTLCHACVGACPTAALGADPDEPLLSFREEACVQCGLCKATCPERAIALEPRLSLADAARDAVVLKREEAFACIRCGTPFAPRAAIERVLAKLDGHPAMGGAMLERVQMCEACRLDAAGGDDPMATRRRPGPRTTEDWLRGGGGER